MIPVLVALIVLIVVADAWVRRHRTTDSGRVAMRDAIGMHELAFMDGRAQRHRPGGFDIAEFERRGGGEPGYR